MGLRETIQSAVVTAFSAVGNIAEDVTYRRKKRDEIIYSEATGSVTEVFEGYPDTSVIFTDYEQKEVDGDNIKSTDKKVLLPGSSIDFEPKQDDQIVKSDGEVWDIKGAETDPVQGLWILQARERDNASNT